MLKKTMAIFAAVVATVALGFTPAAHATTSAVSNTVVTPDGRVVHKLAPLQGKAVNPSAGVFKGKPASTKVMTSLASCDGVTGKACYLYNVGAQNNLSKNGVSTAVRIGGYSGALDTVSDYHTLGEVAVESADMQQIVEAGWTVDPSVNKTSGVGVTTPRPFVYSWVNGVGGTYNGGTFVPVSGAPVTPGVTDLTPGTSAQITIYHDDNLHGWWIGWGSGSSWIGYYPDADWSGATPTATFTRMELVQLFGEIASTKSKPCSDMGTGDGASVTATAAKFSSTLYLNTALGTDTTSVNLAANSLPSTTAGSPYAGAVATTLRTVYYGGPMWNSTGTGVGTKSAC